VIFLLGGVDATHCEEKVKMMSMFIANVARTTRCQFARCATVLFQLVPLVHCPMKLSVVTLITTASQKLLSHGVRYACSMLPVLSIFWLC